MPSRRAVVALLLGLVSPAWSLTEPGSHILNIGMGGGVPLMDIDLATAGGGRERLGSSGLAAGAQYLYQATPAIGIGLDLAGVRFSDHEHILAQSIAASGGSLFTAQPIVRILLLQIGRAHV